MPNTLSTRVAAHMWKKDGKPEAIPSEPTSVGRPWYDRRAAEVMQALTEMGYVVARPRKPRAKSASMNNKAGS